MRVLALYAWNDNDVDLVGIVYSFRKEGLICYFTVVSISYRDSEVNSFKLS